MKYSLLIVLLTQCIFCFSATASNLETAYSNKNLGTEICDTLLLRYQPTINTMTKKGWDHSNSAILHGMEKVYQNNPNKAYLNYIKAFADQYINEDGHISELQDQLDRMHPAIIALFLFQETQEQKYATAATNMLNYFLGTETAASPFNKTPTGGYWHKNNAKYHNVMTVDGLYMIHPFLVRYGLEFNRPELLDIATQQILLASERTFNVRDNLPYQSWDYDKNKPWADPITGTSSQYWSRASGWFSMALIDVLEYLPPSHPNYPKIQTLFQRWAAGAASVQHSENGMWYQVMDAHEQPRNYPEVSGSSMIVYSLQKGVYLGLLDEKYKQTATKGWRGIKTFISEYSDGGPQIHSVAPPMGAQVDYDAYVAKRPISVPSAENGHHPHAFIGTLFAASIMEKSHTRASIH